MVDIDLTSNAIGNRDIRPNDRIIGFDLGQGDPRLAARTDTLTQVIRTMLTNLPSDLTTQEREAIAQRLGLGDTGGGGTELPAYQQSDEEVLHSRAGSLYWDPINEVPIAGRVGHVLTVTGENDDDYAWREAAVQVEDPRIGENAASIAELQTETSAASRSIADANTQRVSGDDIQGVAVATASSYQSTLDSQVGSARPLLLQLTANVTGTRNGETYTWQDGDVLYYAPLSDSAEYLFNVPRVAALASQASLDRERTTRQTSDQTLNDRITGNANAIVRAGRLMPINDWIRTDTARTQLFAWFPLQAVARNARLTIVIGGVTHTISAPEAYEATDVDGLLLSVPVTASNSATITREANTRAGHVRVDLTLGDDTFHAYIAGRDPAAAAPKSSVLRAATEATATTTVTLPTDYATYKWFTVVGFNSAGGSGSVTVPTAWLAARILDTTFTYPTTQNGQTGSYTWVVATRTINADSNTEIEYAELHDY